MRALERVLPAYGWLRTYRWRDLSGDLFAGLTLAVMLVPQGMAYALLAGLPPIMGLYAGTVPVIVYALFSSSRYLSPGPVAIVSLLTFSGVSALAEPGTDEYVGLALLLALMVGVIHLVLGIFRIGFMINFLSHPVISGFTSAAAIVIALSQLKYLLGIDFPSDLSTLALLFEATRRIGETNLITVALGLGSIAGLVLLRRYLPRLPGSLLVVAAATLSVYLLDLEERGVEIVGEVPGSLPSLSLPPLDFTQISALAPTALIITFVGLVESIAVAKAVALRENQKIEPNQELNALGLGNLTAAFFSTYPIAGSFSRTAVNYESGARSQLSSITTALLIVLTLLFLTPLFYYLPNSVLAAIVIVAVYGLIQLREAGSLTRIKRGDGLSFLLTFFLTLLLGVERGLILGALFSIIAFIRGTAYPNITEIGYVKEQDAFRDLKVHPTAVTYPETLIVRFDRSFYFANVSFFEEWLISKVAEAHNLKYIFVDCSGVNDIDTTAVKVLEGMIQGYRSRGINIRFVGMKHPVRYRVEKAGWDERFEGVVEHATMIAALSSVGLMAEPKAQTR